MPQAPNPFQTPTANVNQPQASVFGPTGTFDIGQCFSDAWRLTWANFGVLLGTMIVFGIVAAIATVTIVGIFVVLPVLAYGLNKVLLDAYEEKAEFGDLFSGFSRYGEVLGSMLAYSVCLFLVHVAGSSVTIVGATAGSTVLTGLGRIVSLVWLFLVTIRFNFSGYFIVDEQLGGIDAMKASWNGTSEQKLNIFLLLLLSYVVILVGVLALGIGVLVTGPMAAMMWISAYKQLTGKGAMNRA